MSVTEKEKDVFNFKWNRQLSDDYKSEIEILDFLNLKNLAITAVYTVAMLLFLPFVADALKIVYILFNCLIGWILSLDSRENPKKHIYEQFYYDILKKLHKEEDVYGIVDIKKERKTLNIQSGKYNPNEILKLFDKDDEE